MLWMSDVKQSHCYPLKFQRLIPYTDLFRNNMFVHLPFHLLQSGCNGGEFGRAYCLVQDLLTVPAERRRRYRVTFIDGPSLQHTGATAPHGEHRNAWTNLSCGILSRDTGSSPSTSTNSSLSLSCTSSDRDRKWTAQMHTGEESEKETSVCCLSYKLSWHHEATSHNNSCDSGKLGLQNGGCRMEHSNWSDIRKRMVREEEAAYDLQWWLNQRGWTPCSLPWPGTEKKEHSFFFHSKTLGMLTLTL